ncbi:hypothetical protein [Nonomuraea guangzhouensis]|uniref:ANTAR domain-containing protein n=1 Tax=Nonomuraea guangzhouensis TaxID=1291555 RepID=A0ABW4GWI3_9ACTN|nr:hypothetical protein [Nonomuraea guangzhouensis]
MTADHPNWASEFNEGLARLYGTMRHANGILVGQAALGWAYRGDLERAGDSLAKMDPDQLRELSAAAALLASLADEELSTR